MKKFSRVLSVFLSVALLSTSLPRKVFAASADNLKLSDIVEYRDKQQKKEGKIVGEAVEKREKNVKHFLKDDLTSEAVIYNAPVHYLENGKWKDINNSLLDKKDEENNDVLENKENDFKVKIAKNIKSKKLVTIQKDKYEIQWGIDKLKKVNEKDRANEGITELSDSQAKVKAKDTESLKSLPENEQKKTIQNITSTIDFSNIYPDIDLQYSILANAIKENIIINKKVDNPIFTFNINVKNLVPKVQEDKSIIFYDSKDTAKAVFKIASSFMYDAKGERSSDVEVSLTEDKNSYALTLTPSTEWLNAKVRVYPVTIDPPIETSLDSKNISDSFVASGVPSGNYYLWEHFGVGYGYVSGFNRAFIKFNLPNNLTSADVIINAAMDLYLNKENRNGSQINVHKVTSNWDSKTVTWQNQPSYESKIDNYEIINSAGATKYSLDITRMVKEWYTTGSNYGLMLKYNNENEPFSEFVSSDSQIGYQYARPKITLFYVNKAGLENYWTYHSQSAGRAGTSYVNDFNGNLIHTHDDLSMNGSRMPISLSHIFNNSDKSINLQFGNGWRLNLSQRVTEQTFSDGLRYIHIDEDGTKHYYKADTSGVFKDELGGDTKLTKNGDGSYTIKDKKDNTLNFAATAGYLSTIKDSNGNILSLAYDGDLLKTVTDGVGRVTSLEYDSNKMLTSVTDPSGRKTSYAYNGNRLEKITYSDGKQSSYSYDANGNLTSAVNFDGYKVSYEYYGAEPYRVSKIKESHNDGTAGNELSIAYSYNSTTFMDVKGRKNIYQFNENGNTTNILGSEGNAKYYKYEEAGSNINKIALESKLQKTTINYMKEHNAEKNSSWIPASWSGASGTQSYAAEDKYSGNQSLKVTSTSNSGGIDFEQGGISLEKGKTYTLSAYVKIKDIPIKENSGAALFVGYTDGSGTAQFIKKFMSGTKDWERYELTFTIPQNASSGDIWVGASILESTGTAYFDAFQLEEGQVASRYNLIENNSFIYGGDIPTFWQGNENIGASDKAVNGEALPVPNVLGNRSFKINGNAYTRKNVFQVVNTPGKKGDIFVVGGWAKGESIPDADLGRLGIIIGFKLPNLDAYEWHGFDFNRGSTDWQYLSDRIITQNDYTHIEFYYTYYTNVNKAYFDGAQLYKEEFGASYQYDDKGNLKSTADLSKQTSSFEYSTANDLIKSTDPQGSSFTYAYDSKHNATKATSAQNVVYSFEYDSFGNPKASKVGEGTEYIQSTAEYTPSGNYIKSLTDSSGNTVSYNYNEAKGTLDSFADANGKLTTYGYDNVDRLTSVSKDVQGKSITNSYSYENERIKGITHNGFSYNFGYDSLGNNTSVSVGSQSLITNSYEARTGKLLESTYGNGQKVSSDYDSQDRVTAKKFNGIVRYKYAYDASGNLGYHEDIVNNAAYKYSYDLADRLTRIKDSSNNSTDFSYDLNNNLSKITERFGDFNYTNISLSKPATASSSENASTAPSNAVDNNNGTRWSSQSSDPQWIYVDLGEIKNIRRVVLNWETAYGKSYQIQVSNDASNWTTVYSTNSSDGGIDEINNLSSSGRYVRMYGTQRATSWGYSLWSFDVYDDNSIVTQYEYDKDNKPSKVILNNNKQLSYQYDSIARLKNKTISTDTPYTTSFSYMAGINGSTTNKIEAINNNGKSISYSYDKNGNIKTITDAGRQILYYYNELNELIQEDNQVLNKTIIYSYDDGGNITSKLEIPYGAGAVRKTINYAYDSVWKDKLASYDGKPITYDAIGNPLTYDGWSFEWEEGRQLKSMSWQNHVISYKYNDAGTRTEMTVDGLTTKYHLVGDKVSFEENGTDRIYYSYDSSDNLISMNLNGADYYYTRNAQGDIIGLLDKSGAQVVSYTYDSWGKLISIDGSLKDTVGKKNPYRYRGYRYDTETGLYYLNSRYYNPDWGRFLNADALGGKVGELLSHNVFAYCKNNPINMYDPSGYWSIKNFLQNAWDTIVNKTLATVATIHAGVLTWAKLSVNPDTAPVLEAVGIPTITTVATRSLSKISTKKGGAYSKVSKNGGENHHMPAQSVSPFSKGKGPAINMSKADHRLTASWGNSKEAQLYRANQADLISQGMFKQAQQMDIDNVRGLFGNKYDEGIKQMVDYTITLFKD